jgi:DNA-binding transcriptional LysR family regulator
MSDDWKDWPDGAHLAELVAFVALLKHGSFIRAARHLTRDATVVSRRVRALEERLGVRLVERSTRRVAPTEAGRTLFERTHGLLDQLAEAEGEASSHAGIEPRGTLKVALPGSFGRMWVGPSLAVFLTRYPQLKVEAAFSNRFVDLIGEGFDVAVRLGVLEDSGLVARKVGDRRRLLCVAPDYLERYGAPTHPRELAERPCLAFKGFPAHPVWNLVSTKGERVSVRVTGPLVSDDAEVLVSCAVSGSGIMLTTDWLVGRELADGRLVPVLPEWTMEERGGIYVVVPSNRFLSAKVRAFSDWIAALFSPPPWRVRRASRTTKRR